MSSVSRRLILLTFVVLSMTTLSACKGKWQKMSNQDLAQKRSDCILRNPTAPGSATACENVRKECERRAKDGNYACGR